MEATAPIVAPQESDMPNLMQRMRQSVTARGLGAVLSLSSISPVVSPAEHHVPVVYEAHALPNANTLECPDIPQEMIDDTRRELDSGSNFRSQQKALIAVEVNREVRKVPGQTNKGYAKTKRAESEWRLKQRAAARNGLHLVDARPVQKAIWAAYAMPEGKQRFQEALRATTGYLGQLGIEVDIPTQAELDLQQPDAVKDKKLPRDIALTDKELAGRPMLETLEGVTMAFADRPVEYGQLSNLRQIRLLASISRRPDGSSGAAGTAQLDGSSSVINIALHEHAIDATQTVMHEEDHLAGRRECGSIGAYFNDPQLSDLNRGVERTGYDSDGLSDATKAANNAYRDAHSATKLVEELGSKRVGYFQARCMGGPAVAKFMKSEYEDFKRKVAQDAVFLENYSGTLTAEENTVLHSKLRRPFDLMDAYNPLTPAVQDDVALLMARTRYYRPDIGQYYLDIRDAGSRNVEGSYEEYCAQAKAGQAAGGPKG